MSAVLDQTVFQDELAVSVARMVGSANQRASQLGVNVKQSLITISQHAHNGGLRWRINYGSRDYVGRRGGDLLLEVDTNDASIKQELWGQ